MSEPVNDYPDCDRCDDTELDPDAYIPHETEHGTAYRHAPCRDCQSEWEEGADAMAVTHDKLTTEV
ncbi:hypothetical protein AB0M68_03430 [Streptomyces sp. NPDC051453]|uniref:hypothetical protein n=1 Tax=Streptomyces sp. NPDC051453 TaxID=3154941 RepID=UPI00341F856C